MTSRIWMRISVGACALLATSVLAVVTPAPATSFKILHIMSYHSPWRWTDGQFQGFKEGMQGVNVEYKVFQMDANRANSLREKSAKGDQARALIESWQPDLVYTSDDEAQEFVARRYVGKALPFVFSGVNKSPDSYGFVGSPNVTGVLEVEQFVESVRLLQSVSPGIARIAVVSDDQPMWHAVRQRMRDRLPQLPGTTIVAMDTVQTFAEFKTKVREYQGSADAIALLGVFGFKDDNGRNVPYRDVMKWTVENSWIPDLGFWVDRVHHGSLAAVTVSEREQGLVAGRMARAILTEGRSPSSIPMVTTLKGMPVISLARARKLGINVKSGLLLSADVVERFEWDKP
jgi:ABC-type uncharacterized transport system substrate-binding protein